MKKKQQYELGEAIKNFYETKPLQSDLAKSVANKVFGRRKEAAPVFDRWLYAFAAILFAAGMIYCFSIVRQFSLSLISLVLIPAACYIGLSVKEHWLISKKLLSFQ
ncbi:MAG: hypothetical protein ABI675_00515 [Chitinophagaceae bacterium]